MTESEAIKELHEIRPRGGIIPQKRAEALDMAIQALEKQISRKRDNYSCPICSHYFEDGECFTYCPECGQRFE